MSMIDETVCSSQKMVELLALRVYNEAIMKRVFR